jgi:outer membrane receptor protein involved in Fe transport
MARSIFVSTLAAGFALTAAAAHAQTPLPAAPANGVIAYPLSFFADFRPTNASEMVARIPGFTFSGGDVVRGFAGAAGNVLIDGERPSSKSVTLDDALKRILPGDIVRIDLIRGGAPGIDMQGQPVVANIIRRSGAKIAYAIDATERIYNFRNPGPSLRLEGSRTSGALRLEGAIYAQGYAGYVESGPGNFIRATGAGAVINQGYSGGNGESRIYQANGAAEYKAGDDTYRLTAGVVQSEPLFYQFANLHTPAGVPSFERSLSHNKNRTAELGGDYQHRFNPLATGRLVGLHIYKHNTTVAQTLAPGRLQESNKDNTGGESILRATLSLQNLWGMNFETGGEGAFNYLDATSSVRTNGVLVALPNANVRVEEKRAEGFITATAKPLPKLSLEAGTRIETSRISQSGGATRERSFTFVKPRFIAAYALRPTTQLRMRVERMVGQLDFEDFAASADTNTGVVSAGNANLEPERYWLAEATIEQRFWGRGAIVLTATHRDIQQVADIIPIFTPTGVFSAPGNIGDGTRDELKMNLTLPTEKMGLRGGQFKFNITKRRSRVIDPTTRQERAISQVHLLDGDMSFTQDFPRLKSTLIVESGTFGNKDRLFRVADVQTIVENPTSKATWLYHPRPDLTFAFAVENFASKERTRKREIYSGGLRSTGVVATRELRSAQLDPWLSLRLRKTF